MDGLQLVVAEIALLVSIAALLAGVLGWLLGRGTGKRRAEKKFEQTLAALRLGEAKPVEVPAPEAPTPETTVPVAPPAAPVDAPRMWTPPTVITGVPAPLVAAETEPVPTASVEPEPDAAPPVEPEPVPAPAGAPEPVLPPGPETSEPTSPWSPPDVTVIRPPSAGTATYTPSPFAILPSDPTGRHTSMAEVQELRRQLRAKDLEIGRLEAGALSAWDRTVPQLEAQLSDLLAANDSLTRKLREAKEHSAADALTVDHLRDLVADRDARLAELRSQG